MLSVFSGRRDYISAVVSGAKIYALQGVVSSLVSPLVFRLDDRRGLDCPRLEEVEAFSTLYCG